MSAKSIEHYEDLSFKKYMSKAQRDKAIMTLEGILRGISLDGKIKSKEVEELAFWCNLNRQYINKSFFKEVIPVIDEALRDYTLTREEIEDILWVCEHYVNPMKYYSGLTVKTQRLHGILHGILADNEITDEEIIALKEWIDRNTSLMGSYPYEEIKSLLLSILEDGVISEEERNILKLFFSEFVDLSQSLNLNALEIEKLQNEITIHGICMNNPEITFKDKLFCFTGVSSRAKRGDIARLIEERGGKYNDNVTGKTDYLIVGNEGNPCWAFSCYGRKVEKAMNMRKEGKQICIVNEIDFWGAVQSASSKPEQFSIVLKLEKNQ
ncbi:MAG: NAD-dependent DNA ligase [Clostridiaceae bacterium]|nr:NAD-dependent DNA ligase [Clostridiaceae bacterium]